MFFFPILMTIVTMALPDVPSTAPSAPPPGPVVIVAFGDSTTAPRKGVTGFTEQLAKQLAGEDRATQIINAGVPGNNTHQARQRFATDVLAHRPDVVTIWFGINDSAIDVWKGESEPRVPLQEYAENLDWMVTQLQTHGIQPVLFTPNPCAWTDELRRLYGKPPYRPDDPDGWNVLLKDYAAATRQVAKARGVPLVDVYQLFHEYAGGAGHHLNDLLIDGMHPNDAGHAIIAEHLAESLRTFQDHKVSTTRP